MKIAIVSGKELKITDHDYKQLLKRFDINNFKKCENYVDCPFCEKYCSKLLCESCPCCKNGLTGCADIIDTVAKIRNNMIELGYTVSYFGRTGRNQIKKIHKWLVEDFK